MNSRLLLSLLILSISISITVYSTSTVLVDPIEPAAPQHKFESAQTAAELTSIDNIWQQFKKGSDVSKSAGRPIRQAHVKAHGAVLGRIRIANNIKSSLAVGLFSNPNTEYNFYGRFSAGGGPGFAPGQSDDFLHSSDTSLNNRALAIKLYGNSDTKWTRPFLTEYNNENTIDLHFTTNTCPFAKDINEAEGFFSTVRMGLVRFGLFLATHPKLAYYYIQTGRSGNVDSLMEATYSSSIPLAFGPNNAAKLRLRPSDCNSAAKTMELFDYNTTNIIQSNSAVSAAASINNNNDNQYHDSLSAHLLSDNTCYTLEAAEYINEDQTPVEAGAKDWSNSLIWSQLALVIIPAQSIDKFNPTFVSQTAFNPWNMLAEHQPIGSTSRVRRVIYTKIQRYRALLENREFKEVSWADVLKAAGK